jgi:hypothetical protein
MVAYMMASSECLWPLIGQKKSWCPSHLWSLSFRKTWRKYQVRFEEISNIQMKCHTSVQFCRVLMMVYDIPEYSSYFGYFPLPIYITKHYVSDGGSASETQCLNYANRWRKKGYFGMSYLNEQQSCFVFRRSRVWTSSQTLLSWLKFLEFYLLPAGRCW